MKDDSSGRSSKELWDWLREVPFACQLALILPRPMDRSFQHQKPPSRVDLTLDVETGDANEEIELPLRLLVMSDLTGRQESTPLDERDIIRVDRTNFPDVMASYDLRLEYEVPDRLAGEGTLTVDLDFDSLDDFEPEAVAQQVPELSRLLAARNLLKDLRNRLISMGEFRSKLETIIADESSRARLQEELREVVPDGRETPEQKALPETKEGDD